MNVPVVTVFQGQDNQKTSCLTITYANIDSAQNSAVCSRFIYCVALKRLATPSDFHIPLPSTVPFAYSQIHFTHRSIYPIFPGCLVLKSFSIRSNLVPRLWYKIFSYRTFQYWFNASTPNLVSLFVWPLGLNPVRQGRPYQQLRYRRHSTRDPRATQAHSTGTKYLLQGGDTFGWAVQDLKFTNTKCHNV